MKHVVSFSGGKDSTALLLMMLEKGMQIDDIVYFDCGDWEFPQMAEHIRQVEEYIGRQITRLYPSRGDLNYWMFDYKPKPRKGNTPQIGKAWPGPTLRWCTGLKRDAINKYYSQYRGEGIISYIGFAADEINRMIRPNISARWYETRFPLYDFDMTETDCLEYCYSKGFTWGGLYNYFKRVSCWCCPLQSLKDLKQLYIHFPDLWARLRDMDKRAWNTFRADGKSVEDLEKRFYFEEVQQMKLVMPL
jgi:3'-phosphoadenosine 5'-phosphosulfate sulfotransferase (PAPS reductase)/FAD synthetase